MAAANRTPARGRGWRYSQDLTRIFMIADRDGAAPLPAVAVLLMSCVLLLSLPPLGVRLCHKAKRTLLCKVKGKLAVPPGAHVSSNRVSS
jgi:hypothetical protein